MAAATGTGGPRPIPGSGGDHGRSHAASMSHAPAGPHLRPSSLPSGYVMPAPRGPILGAARPAVPDLEVDDRDGDDGDLQRPFIHARDRQ